MTDTQDPTLAELREQAREAEIEGRSSMNKAELAAALGVTLSEPDDDDEPDEPDTPTLEAGSSEAREAVHAALGSEDVTITASSTKAPGDVGEDSLHILRVADPLNPEPGDVILSADPLVTVHKEPIATVTSS